MTKYAQPNSKLVRDYDLTMAWYYTYLEEDYPQTCAYLFKAYDITNIISTSELAKIDDQLCPISQSDAGMAAIRSSGAVPARFILTCGDHGDRRLCQDGKSNCWGHLLEVYFRAEITANAGR